MESSGDVGDDAGIEQHLLEEIDKFNKLKLQKQVSLNKNIKKFAIFRRERPNSCMMKRREDSKFLRT